MLTDDAILTEFREAGALLEGHFILSSGFHSSAYLQCARVLMDPSRAARLCQSLAAKISAAGLAADLDLIVSPAMGGVIAGYEMGRQLGLPAIFFERVAGAFELRRGFQIEAGQRCLLMEDVVTTGLSSRECMDAVRALGAALSQRRRSWIGLAGAQAWLSRSFLSFGLTFRISRPINFLLL